MGQSRAQGRRLLRSAYQSTNLVLADMFTDFYRFLQIFRRLVLGWIDSYDSNQILIFSDFSRSTRFAKWNSGILQIFAEFREIFMKFPHFWRLLLKSQQIGDFSLQF